MKIRPETKWSNYEQVRILKIDWTRVCGKILRGFIIRGERLIKLSYSWFFVKSILVECWKICLVG